MDTESKINPFLTIYNNLSLTLYVCQRYTGGSEWYHPDVYSSFTRLYFVMDGESSIENQQERVILRPGYVYLIPTFTTNTYQCTTRLDKWYVHCNAEVYSSYNLFAGSSILSRPFHPAEATSHFCAVQTGRVQDTVGLTAYLYNTMASFLQLLPEVDFQTLRSLEKYKEMHRYIKEHVSAALTPKAVASYMGCKENTLYKHYKADTGFTVKQTIDRQLIAKAQLLLDTTALSIRRISEELEFCDEFYFSNFFHRLTGMRPAAYRKRSLFMD